MLTSYIRAAMRQARYEIVEDDGSFYGEIPAIPGVWSNAETLEACREELESVLEGCVLVSIADHSPIPDITSAPWASIRLCPVAITNT
jgi:predicted RNase H-like HicB family nuclease